MPSRPLRAAVAAAALFPAALPAALADNAADRGRAALRDCLQKLPLNRLADERAIAQCLDQGQRAAEAEDKRQG
ncbi:MAG: hypothetical protein ACT4N4_14675, partial [Rhodospirillales bacterium]